MRKVLAVVMASMMMLLGAVGAVSPVLAEGNDWTSEACGNADAQQKAALGCDKDETAPSVITYILNAVISIVGIVAVFVIVIAGQRYIVSNGDPGKLQQAKNMILYGLIGVIVAVLSFAVVNFILSGVFS